MKWTSIPWFWSDFFKSHCIKFVTRKKTSVLRICTAHVRYVDLLLRENPVIHIYMNSKLSMIRAFYALSFSLRVNNFTEKRHLETLNIWFFFGWNVRIKRIFVPDLLTFGMRLLPTKTNQHNDHIQQVVQFVIQSVFPVLIICRWSIEPKRKKKSNWKWWSYTYLN